jgi:hypothetical protein
MSSRIEEDFELELRALPGVVNVGVARKENGDVDVVTLAVNRGDAVAIRAMATQIASLYFPLAAIVVEDVSGALGSSQPDRSRVALMAADYDDQTGVSEVRLSVNGRTVVGRAEGGQLAGGALATLDALRNLGFDIPFTLLEVNNSFNNGKNYPVIVTLQSLSNDDDRYGIARADDNLVSVAKATLDALNRFLSTLDVR